MLFGAAQVSATWTVIGQVTDGSGPDGMAANPRRAFAAPDLSRRVAYGADAVPHSCVNCGGTIDLRIGTTVARVITEPDSGPTYVAPMTFGTVPSTPQVSATR
ncbi:hypothetical protein [Actinacidiphila epipremni]|uniref:Uncharacterized protein n=1 Tax=Actinacidiphila epipremni TaxID=2053013 RepID=A0ABX0ZLL3_9ACTN|nr:hypothetical protein [Actinacidiphila epipremni]NJP42541.1 hypothetical protein [Actinacidiphila epipremni]